MITFIHTVFINPESRHIVQQYTTTTTIYRVKMEAPTTQSIDNSRNLPHDDEQDKLIDEW